VPLVLRVPLQRSQVRLARRAIPVRLVLLVLLVRKVIRELLVPLVLRLPFLALRGLLGRKVTLARLARRGLPARRGIPAQPVPLGLRATLVRRVFRVYLGLIISRSVARRLAGRMTLIPGRSWSLVISVRSIPIRA
jgi:hypothetical protein